MPKLLKEKEISFKSIILDKLKHIVVNAARISLSVHTHTHTHIQLPYAIVLWAQMADGRWRLLSMCPWLIWHHQHITALVDWHHWSCSLSAEGIWRPDWLPNEYYIPECLNSGDMMTNLGQSGNELFQICIDNPSYRVVCLQCDMIFHMALGTQSPQNSFKVKCKIFITPIIYNAVGLDSSVL